jgi:predicted component of type VI protein secretion system
MSPVTYQLTIRTGPNPGETYLLTGNEISIGRDATNQIVINDTEVSRRHARLILQGDTYLFQDLGSTNGSFVNAKRLMGPRLLHSGEVITLGQSIKLVYEVVQPDLDATVLTPVAGPPAAGMPATSMPAAATSAPTATRIETPPASPVYQAPKKVQAGPVQAGPVQAQPVRSTPVTPPPPIYGDPAQAPVEAYPSTREETSQGSGLRWVIASCGVVALFACLALSAFFFWVDAGGADRWCQIFGFIFPACP